MRTNLEPEFVKAFGRGICAGAGTLVLIALGLQLGSGGTLQHEQEKLALQIAPIERSGAQPTPPPHEETHEQQPQEHAVATTAHVTGPPVAVEIKPPPETHQTTVDSATDSVTTTVPEVTVPTIAVANDAPLGPVPVEGLYEDTTDGRLPKIGKSESDTPFRAYRRPFDVYANDQPVIALGITGLGISAAAFADALKNLPPEVSFVMTPYANDLGGMTEKARAKGHETWLSLPMETSAYPAEDPGPQGLLVSAPEKDNLKRLNWVMSRTNGYAGVVSSSPDATVMKSPAVVRSILSVIYNRGLGFVDSAPQPGAVPQTIAIGMKAPYGNIDVMVDANPSKEEIDVALKKLETIAKEQGVAAGMIHPLPVSTAQIAEWSKTLADKGIRLAPLSAATQ